MGIEKIVSGGQTGADRAGLDWARDRGLPHEGWCPLGRRAEDGAIDAGYRLQETPGSDYITRTEWNVRDSDATVIFSLAAELSGGSAATRRFCRKLGRPCLHLSREGTAGPGAALRDFVERHDVRVLNVAGPRASGEPGVAEFVRAVLGEAFAGGAESA